ncbi:type II secretion system F family protein [Arthrobacter sp. HY1533]|uniref:type II secretion system F family protein n=1 Tax=Arthrobacter sp. HY1533 TaxID=2970919 RepID=UPI0022B9EF6C|nr:type II secretion system F family protein [Arthrobacter sp. HY1533]
MNAGVILLGVFLCLAALLVALFVVFRPRQSKVPRSQLVTIKATGTGDAAAGTLSKATSSATEAINGLLERRGVRYSLGTTLELAGVKARPADFIIWVAAVTALSAVMLTLLELPILAFLALGVVPLLAWAFLKFRTERRQTAFDDQLGDTLQLLSGGMRAGHSMMHAIDAAAADSDAPMSEELARVVNETRLGRDTGESLMATAARMHSEDFSWVAQAIEINREVGGDLAEVLDHVGNTIRDRNQIRRQVNSLSAEGRTSALVLFCLPVVLSTAMALISPSYFAPLFKSPFGLVVLVVSLVLMGLGGLWLRAVVKIKF